MARKSNLPQRTLEWTEDDLPAFAGTLLREAKPRIVAANKADAPEGESNFNHLLQELAPARNPGER